MASTSTSASTTAVSFEKKLRKYMKILNDFSHKTSWYPDFDKLELSIESASETPIPTVSFRFKVIDELCGVAGILHGGCMVLLVDDLTTVLLGAVSKPGLFSRYGASKNLNTTFIRPLALGDEARIVSEVEYFGKRRAVLRAKLYRVEGNELCAILENDRANTDPPTLSKL
ncbi:hypothetical protein N7466_000597 [Penicillium verhagenii]|uniref:uncharacterized protein n=1 Tax=Penicillium verhagenii TaxID=1562060 RepID=UPI0025457E27|nr:uncharacterized protein N7466_000597 [Penicillium verhagenii]KAJ5947582.1 hypothetical protein N7466_000597 [Penicillium verhagenii]